MSETSLIHELEAKLENIRRNVEEIAKLDQDLFSNRLALKSARSLEQLYQAQLAEARRLSVEAYEMQRLLESSADAEFHLSGGLVTGHDVDLRKIGEFFVLIQSFFYTCAAAAQGVLKNRGHIRNSMVHSHKLLLVPEFVPGSFGFRVRVPRPNEYGEFIDSEAREALSNTSLMLCADPDGEGVSQVLSHSRVRSEYRKLVEFLAENNTDLRILEKVKKKSYVFLAKEARIRKEWLETIESKDSEEEFVGYLIGGNIETLKFELRPLDDGKPIRGNMSPEATTQLKRFRLGDKVTALIRIEEQAAQGTESRSTSYYALSFEPST